MVVADPMRARLLLVCVVLFAVFALSAALEDPDDYSPIVPVATVPTKP